MLTVEENGNIKPKSKVAEPKAAEPVSFIKYPEDFYETPLFDSVQEKNARNDLIMELYGSMFGYILNHWTGKPCLRPLVETMDLSKYVHKFEVFEPKIETTKKQSQSIPKLNNMAVKKSIIKPSKSAVMGAKRKSMIKRPSSTDQPELPKTVVKKPETVSLFLERDQNVKLEFKSGCSYEGRLSKSVIHGNGKMHMNNGIVFEGSFYNGSPGGSGKITWPDGSWFEGDFLNGMRHGRGLHVSAREGRRTYGGEWVDGKRQGFGWTERGDDGDATGINYIGSWLNDRMNGWGSAQWPDGTQYGGQWINDKPCGRGTAVWPNKDVYEGDWLDGYMEGTGRYEWNTVSVDNRLALSLCDRYTGQWSKSKKNGFGIYQSSAGIIIRGHWSEDALEGPAEIVLKNGKVRNNLYFRRGFLYEMPADSGPASSPLSSSPPPSSPLSSQKTSSRFSLSCTPVTNPVAPLVDDDPDKIELGDGTTGSMILIAVDVNIQDESHDFTEHVRKATAKCLEETVFAAVDHCGNIRLGCPLVISPDDNVELESVGYAVDLHMAKIKSLYHAYAVCPRGYDPSDDHNPLMMRLGLWQMLKDYCFHTRVSLAEFDDVLYENKKYLYKSAHDPFEPIYFWQFLHAICELANMVDRVRDREEESCIGVMASALHRLLEVDMKNDFAPQYGGTWVNNRNTLVAMYDVFKAMFGHDLPTGQELMLLFCPKRRDDGQPDTVLASVLNVMEKLRERAEGPATASVRGSMKALKCTSLGVIEHLLSACPKMFNTEHMVIVNAGIRFTFGEWYDFIMLCVQDFREVTIPIPIVKQCGSATAAVTESTTDHLSTVTTLRAAAEEKYRESNVNIAQGQWGSLHTNILRIGDTMSQRTVAKQSTLNI